MTAQERIAAIVALTKVIEAGPSGFISGKTTKAAEEKLAKLISEL